MTADWKKDLPIRQNARMRELETLLAALAGDTARIARTPGAERLAIAFVSEMSDEFDAKVERVDVAIAVLDAVPEPHDGRRNALRQLFERSKTLMTFHRMTPEHPNDTVEKAMDRELKKFRTQVELVLGETYVSDIGNTRLNIGFRRNDVNANQALAMIDFAARKQARADRIQAMHAALEEHGLHFGELVNMSPNSLPGIRALTKELRRIGESNGSMNEAHAGTDRDRIFDTDLADVEERCEKALGRDYFVAPGGNEPPSAAFGPW